MANIALDGTADELGISSANLWLQPASEANDWDVFGGIDAFFDSPLDVLVAHIPAGITFPSVKDLVAAGARQQPSHHACQILVPACFEWFSRSRRRAAAAWPAGAAGGQPPRAAARLPVGSVRGEQGEVEAASCSSCCTPTTQRRNGKVAFCDISTPVTIENYLRQGDGIN